MIEACVDAFLRTPAEIHLDAERLLERFEDARIVTSARTPACASRAAADAPAAAEKRAFDLARRALGLLVARRRSSSLVALLIRLESPGPALFRQTRYGFNQEPFRIFKFRTMRTMEDGAKVDRRHARRSRA